MPEGSGPLLGIDFGERRIGIAVLGELGWAPQGVATLRNGESGPDWEGFARILKDWQPRAIVLGLPLNMDGSEGLMVRRVRNFAKSLQRRFPLPVHWVDERLSSHAAEWMLKERALSAKQRAGLLDQAAACEILQTFQDVGAMQ
ncbi:Holliday junction resolvase RuvX [Acidithiobacillus thiooxidans]|uniref:Holliday junction resolvase RuvX n=1 Tax=Acidithiobacillus thiooxidans TaxID=930 RepID=UPI001C07BA60|nr:Holliday junction resolvase RuvX [Acidithiobacillus thiooxidans]MBU2842607.1 Holliday junction resolvase RuvX [Acidithiobacillus thiooxidans]